MTLPILKKENAIAQVAARYAVAITPDMAALIDETDPNDPIARQFVPSEAELITTPEELSDPIGDEKHSPVPGIVHRYPDRVLFKPVHVCPVYCRFCFRREMVGPGGEAALSPQAFDKAFAYVAAHPEIREIIVTGGDPFILTARRAAEISARASAILHIKTLRWHTRVPVVEPARITEEFVAAIKLKTGETRVAIHANHPRELTEAARAACARLSNAGIALLSQSVLLKGVNDNVDTLEVLMRAFVEIGIKPYYLHHPDLAPGTSHFRVSIAQGQALMRELRRRISPTPDYVLDIPGGFAKVSLMSDNVIELDDGWRVRDPSGVWHDYR
ncbi:MAG TPA: lysine-2,3-aminomutase-like protein [Rhizomicrobium sp.]|nr:lysine-2,3-aminomutase-like protein [Rhizomicrobium sp.]